MKELDPAEVFRNRPRMYFGADRGDPRLATLVASIVARDAFHPGHATTIVVDITGDLAFTVTDDVSDPDMPRLGHGGTLIAPGRWSLAAAAAVSLDTTVEVWRNGRGYRQRLAGLVPVGEPLRFVAPGGSGTRTSYVLDPAFFGTSALTADIDPHGPHCCEPPGPGSVTINDLRTY